MANAIELKRSFLVRYMPAQIEGARSEIITDVYIPESANQASLRLRQRGEHYELTRKLAVNNGDFSQLNEFTIELSAEEYAAFRPLSSKLVRKRRFYCTIFGRQAEVDVFTEALDGLVLINFPFRTLPEMQTFQPPEVCLAEVTQQRIASGGYLAGKSYGDIQYELDQLQYVPQFLDH